MARRLRLRGVCAAPEFWQERLRVLAGRLRISRPVGLLESCLAGVPVVIGHLRPVILMPVGLLTGLPAAQIESILLHELAHIRRYDYLVNMLQTLVEGLLFYHPVVWWISGVIRTEREHCCDDLAVTLSGDAHEYALALANLEQSRWDPSEIALAATGGNLVKRIRRLLIPTEGPTSALTPFVSAGILMITAAVGLTAWQEKAPVAQTYLPRLRLDKPRHRQSRPRRFLLIPSGWKKTRSTSSSPKNATRSCVSKQMTNALSSSSNSGSAAIPRLAPPKTSSRTNITGASHTRTCIFRPRPARPAGKPIADASTSAFGPPNEIDDHSTGDTAAAVPYIDWTYRWIEAPISAPMSRSSLWTQPRPHDFKMTLDPNPPAK